MRMSSVQNTETFREGTERDIYRSKLALLLEFGQLLLSPLASQVPLRGEATKD